MRFDILTLFPALCDTVLSESIIGRARQSGAIDVRLYNIRDYSEDRHRRVDDTPYGGGKGMLMAAPPICACHAAACAPDNNNTDPVRRRTVYLSPKGARFDQNTARRYAADYDNLILICGHYEGIDQRVIDSIVDEELSVGDFVLTGGEIPACIVVDAVARLVPGVLAASECHEIESFSGGLLEFPQYTRPYEFNGMTVPEVLISGDHAKIDRWRLEQAESITRRLRPDLYSGERSVNTNTKKKSK